MNDHDKTEITNRVVHQGRSRADGPADHWTIMCPGCREPHAVNSTWTFNGDLDYPTFSPSLLVNAPGEYHNPGVPTCHSFVSDGRIEFLSDCTHAMAGHTVTLEAW